MGHILQVGRCWGMAVGALILSGGNIQAQASRQEVINHFQPVIPRLSPVPDKVGGLGAAIIDLDGTWQVALDGRSEPGRIVVPGELEMQGYTMKEGDVAAYSRKLAIPADWGNQRVKLRFDGVSSHCVVKVNGIKVGEHEGSFVPFEMDITEALHGEDNVLEVDVSALTISDKLACTSQYAAHTVAGILRKVTLFALPELNIAGASINTTLDDHYRNADLNIDYSIANESSPGMASGSSPGMANGSLRAGKGQLLIKLFAKDGKEVLTYSSGKSTVIGGGMLDQHVSIPVKAPQLWNPEHPYLYTLQIQLSENGKVLETQRQKIGFRQVKVDGNRLLVNGMPVKLHGVNRHDIYPLSGRSITPELSRKDAELFKQGNVNYIRTSHYPPTQEFLDAADSLGLFVESEASLCWIGHGASPIWELWDENDPRFLPYMVQANIEKVIAQRNHPSIILWSLGNESYWTPLWAKVNEVVKHLDPTRPTSFHDQCWGGYNNGGSKADIAVYHYPGLNGPAACDTMRRPVLFGEYAHISCYSRRELLTDPGVREAYGPPLVQMYDSMYQHDACLGGAIWSGLDDVFHMPDGRTVGYGPWGPIDAWRRIKPEYYGMKRAYAPVVITNLNTVHMVNGQLPLEVENRYDFTNLNKLKMTCVIDGKEQAFSANIAPHQKGVLTIPVSGAAKVLDIRFYDPGGFIADEEQIHLGKEDAQSSTMLASGTPAGTVPLSISQNDSTGTITVGQGSVQYRINKWTGIMVDAQKNGKEILRQGPVCSIVPMNREDGGMPSAAGATYQNAIYPLQNYPLLSMYATHVQSKESGDSIVIAMDITYDGGKGTQSYTFTSDGRLIVRYKIAYTGDDTLPRQYGLLLKLPVTFDRISWQRKGSFSWYPQEDIGRLEGTALLAAKPVNGVGEWATVPTNDWKQDANDLGSVDFRSTKRFILKASLTDQQGDGIVIHSDGTQSVRSWLQDQYIQLLVADYNNNGSEPFYGSPHTAGRINIKNKTIEGQVVLTVL
jgi:beta-galactosidase